MRVIEQLGSQLMKSFKSQLQIITMTCSLFFPSTFKLLNKISDNIKIERDIDSLKFALQFTSLTNSN